MRLLLITVGLLLICSVSSCKKCGHCVDDSGYEGQSYCYNDNPNIYNTYKNNCEYRTDAKWVMDK